MPNKYIRYRVTHNHPTDKKITKLPPAASKPARMRLGYIPVLLRDCTCYLIKRAGTEALPLMEFDNLIKFRKLI